MDPGIIYSVAAGCPEIGWLVQFLFKVGGYICEAEDS